MSDPALRIPLLVRYPRYGKVARVTKKIVMNIDLAPTILDFASIDPPASMQGCSLRPIVEGRTTHDWRQSVYYAYYENSWELQGAGVAAMSEASFRYFTPHRVGPHRGIRTHGHKLIEYYGEGDHWEFFDLAEDPDEIRNRYLDSACSEIVAGMKTELLNLCRLYGDNHETPTG